MVATSSSAAADPIPSVEQVKAAQRMASPTSEAIALAAEPERPNDTSTGEGVVDGYGYATEHAMNGHSGANGHAPPPAGYSQTGQFVGYAPPKVKPNASHPGMPPREVARTIPCRFFPNCAYGDSCAFAHIGPTSPMGMPAMTEPSSPVVVNGSPPYSGGFYYPTQPGAVDPNGMPAPPMDYATYAAMGGPFGPMHAPQYFHPSQYQRNPYMPMYTPGNPYAPYAPPAPSVSPSEHQPKATSIPGVPSAPRAHYSQGQGEHVRSPSTQAAPMHQAPRSPVKASSYGFDAVAEDPALSAANSPAVSPAVEAALQPVPTVAETALQSEAAVPSPSPVESAQDSQAEKPITVPSTASLPAKPQSVERMAYSESAKRQVDSPPPATQSAVTLPNVAAKPRNSLSYSTNARRSNGPSAGFGNVSGPRQSNGVSRHYHVHTQPKALTACSFFPLQPHKKEPSYCMNGDSCEFAHSLPDGTDAKSLHRNMISADGTVGDPVELAKHKPPPRKAFGNAVPRGRPVGDRDQISSDVRKAAGNSVGSGRSDAAHIPARPSAQSSRSQQRIPTRSDFPSLPLSPQTGTFDKRTSPPPAAIESSAPAAEHIESAPVEPASKTPAIVEPPSAAPAVTAPPADRIARPVSFASAAARGASQPAPVKRPPAPRSTTGASEATAKSPAASHRALSPDHGHQSFNAVPMQPQAIAA